MRHIVSIAICFTFLPLFAGDVTAQESTDDEAVDKKAEQLATDTKAKVDEIAGKVDESEEAKEITAGILQPIYAMAEYLSFPAVHWVAFALMATGVVSFAVQLVLAKLVMLAKFGFSFTEICSDILGLTISLVGLVLTTQAAAENSNFTQSPAAVLSAFSVGVVSGFIFYWWGQKQEIQAAKGRRHQTI
jgi:hypothetical protein